MITISDVVYVPLHKAIQSPQTPYKACSKYIGSFDKYSAQHGIPSIVFAAIAMQESSCNPNEVGGAGEQGLMQITKDKCKGAPGGNCKEVVSTPFNSPPYAFLIFQIHRTLTFAPLPSTLQIL